MLQQILNDMYIDPDVLEALNEEQKRILFIKMREEQVRRWKEREEKDAKGEMKKEKLRQKKGPCKSVSWLLGSDGDVHVCIIGESDDIKSPKLILAELRNKTTDNLNNINRANTEPVNNSLTKVIREPQTSTDEGIQLLLKKPEELRHTGADTDEWKQDSGSDHSADDTKGQTDDSDSTEEEIGLYKPHFSSTAATLADSLNEVRLHRAMKEQLSITDETRPLNKPYKGTVRMKDSSVSGNRVAQLRKTFNTTNDNGPAPCVKPPIPSKPLHLLTSPSVR